MRDKLLTLTIIIQNILYKHIVERKKKPQLYRYIKIQLY